MVCTPAVLLLLSVAVPEQGEEGRGSTFDAQATAEARKRVRLGATVAGGAHFGLTFGSDNAVPRGGLGLSLDLGLMLGDHVALFAHGEVSTLIVFLMTSGGAAFEVFLNDRLSLGGGVSLVGHFGGVTFLGLGLPFRASYFPTARDRSERARSGLVIGLQLGPAFSLLRWFDNFTMAFTAAVTVGYGWW